MRIFIEAWGWGEGFEEVIFTFKVQENVSKHHKYWVLLRQNEYSKIIIISYIIGLKLEVFWFFLGGGSIIKVSTQFYLGLG